MGSPNTLRRMNDRAALYLLLDAGPMTRADLEQASGLSKPAAADLLKRLEAAGQVRRAGHRAATRGPQAQLWTVNERTGFAAGADVTESGIDVVVADISGKHVGEATVTGGSDPVASTKEALRLAAREAGVRRHDLHHLVIGISGSVDPTSGMLSHAEHLPEWNGFDIQGRLSQALGIPVDVENDVNLVMSDEAIRGRAVGANEALLLWMDTGVATALISGGRLHRGFRGSAGELDFVPASPGDPRIGQLLATPAVADLAREHGIADEPVVSLLATAVARAAEGGSHDCFLNELAARIAGVLAYPVALIDPELVILAGAVGTAGGDELADRVRVRLRETIYHRPRVMAGTGHDNSVRQGALDAALEQLRETIFGHP